MNRNANSEIIAAVTSAAAIKPNTRGALHAGEFPVFHTGAYAYYNNI
jgi:hypothetical protein